MTQTQTEIEARNISTAVVELRWDQRWGAIQH